MTANHKTNAQFDVLIEKWLPIEALSAECMRERGASSALPPLYFLHVWWARRPLLVSRAAILAGILPSWQSDWPRKLKDLFPTEDSYRNWYLRACGILGDPVAGRKLLRMAADQGRKIPNPYNSPRAFSVSPDEAVLETLSDILSHVWGKRTLSVLDPFSGGGSIPFEALRYGFKTYANELNPVASVILRATLDYPFRYGRGLGEELRRYGKQLYSKVQKRLASCFTDVSKQHPHAVGAAYIWARTIPCPYTGKPIPLAPNWWLQKGTQPVAVEPLFPANAKAATFRIVEGKTATAKINPDLGTIRRGDAISPWAHNQPIPGIDVKRAAMSGRMGQQLYAVAVKVPGGFEYRPPSDADIAAVHTAEEMLNKLMPAWQMKELVPAIDLPMDTESWTHGNTPAQYGAQTFADLFSPRQLLSICMFAEELDSLAGELLSAPAPQSERNTAILTLLALCLDKAVDYNSRQLVWHPARQVVAHTFQRHEFSFKWSFAEFDASRNFYPWVVEQVADAYEGIANLAAGNKSSLLKSASGQQVGPGAGETNPLTMLNGSAASMVGVADGTIDHICCDPPYYDNVMYAECSDYFYVWMKRQLSKSYPYLFSTKLTGKDEEAVANHARFADMGRKKKALALADYERKMAASFREMHRVLRDDGVLTVMFTHKRVDAWDTLATSLVGAGFAVKSSWPVHTESEHSMHQAKKNSAQSTILLSCRKRKDRTKPVWWDDIKGRVRKEARAKAAEFEKVGIRGVDLYIATFGPTLSILSEHWPVLSSEVDAKTGDPKPLRPEVALDLAREEVVKLRKQGLLLGRTVQFDPATDWYLMAWDAFKAETFPGDEARKLAIALGLDLERDVVAGKRLVAKKGNMVDIQKPTARRKRDMVDGDKEAFDCWVDAVHTAMMLQEEDGSAACKTFLNKTGLIKDSTFKACVQAMINAIPRTKSKGKFVRPEADTLEAMRLAFFDDLVAPAEEEPPKVAVQATFGGEDFEEADGDDEGEEDSES